MIPENDIPLTAEQIERWPALGFYLGVLNHLAPGAVRSFRAPHAPESDNSEADAWCVELKRDGERWLVCVDQKAANPGEQPFWRQPAILNLLAAMRKNLGGVHLLQNCPAAIRSTWSLLVSHPTRPMSVAEVAAAVDLSAGHLGERFEEIMGVSFRRAMRDERIATSIGSLENTDRRVSEIAAGLGGQSLSQFNRNFVAATGVTPSLWRERFGKRQEVAARIPATEEE